MAKIPGASIGNQMDAIQIKDGVRIAWQDENIGDIGLTVGSVKV
jgi:hypothetical protein